MDFEWAQVCEVEVLLRELCKKMECYARTCLKDGKQRWQGEIGDFARVVAL